MLILIVLVYATYQTVIYEFSTSSNINDGWEDQYGNTNFYNCGQIKYFGSPDNYFMISRIFIDLEPHSHIMVDAEFLSIDQHSFEFSVNIQSFDNEQVITTQNNLCGNTQSEQIHTISKVCSHNSRSVWMQLDFYFGGLISLKLSINKCQNGNDGCIENYHTNYLQWKLHQYSFNQKLITNSDGWTFLQNYLSQSYCGNCQFLIYQEIQYSTQLPPHQDVLIRFFQFDITIIIIDYSYGKQQFDISYLIEMGHCKIEILIKNHNDPIFLLNIKTQQVQDSLIRDFEVFYTQPQIQNQNLKEGCLEQVYDKCLICKDGWIQEEYLENCHPICGDGIIQGQEECDDGNQISNDSCYLCKYQCIEFCDICQFGICLNCVDGFEFSLNKQKCMPICNDGIIQEFETCDDQNNIQFDGCYKCQSNCDLRCQFCKDQKCQLCEIGWKLIDDKCYSICGDGIIITGYEVCDDGNIEPNDGCYQCQYECSLGCLVCEKEQFCKKCDSQYILNNQTAKCQLIQQQENKNESENENNDIDIDIDKNENANANSNENANSNSNANANPLNIVCHKNFILIDNQCVNQCGNGLLQKQEECDDGNYQAADGCQDCLIEQNWRCIFMNNDSPSQCTYVKAPNILINYLNMTSNKQYISIQFNQQVKIYSNQPLSETFNFELSNIDKQQWNSSLYIIQDIGSSMSFGEYIVQIEVYQLLDFRPVLKIVIDQLVANIDNAPLEEFASYITLKYPKYLDEKQKDYSYKLKSLNKYLIYSLSGITCVSLLL